MSAREILRFGPFEMDPAAVADMPHCVRSTGTTAAYVMNTEVMPVRATHTARSQASIFTKDRTRAR